MTFLVGQKRSENIKINSQFQELEDKNYHQSFGDDGQHRVRPKHSNFCMLFLRTGKPTFYPQIFPVQKTTIQGNQGGTHPVLELSFEGGFRAQCSG